MVILLVLVVLGLPFLAPEDGMDPATDAGRSEEDVPFAEQLAATVEEIEFEGDLAAAIDEATEEWFGMDFDRAEASPKLAGAGVIDVTRLASGRLAYEVHCIGCHGTEGDGAGPAAAVLDPRPRNFLQGEFKFTSTDYGERPLREDLVRTLENGLTGSAMPGFELLPTATLYDLAEYVRFLGVRGEFRQLMLDVAWDEEEIPNAAEWAEVVNERWHPDELRPIHPAVQRTDATPEAIARGRALFVQPTGTNCAACHGEGGKGDGPAVAEGIYDAWGYRIVPRDLTTGVYRAGDTPEALYVSIATGIGGTPMPGYRSSLEPEQIWDIVHFIRDLAAQAGSEER